LQVANNVIGGSKDGIPATSERSMQRACDEEVMQGGEKQSRTNDCRLPAAVVA
jgi:hypothetical protein